MRSRSPGFATQCVLTPRSRKWGGLDSTNGEDGGDGNNKMRNIENSSRGLQFSWDDDREEEREGEDEGSIKLPIKSRCLWPLTNRDFGSLAKIRFKSLLAITLLSTQFKAETYHQLTCQILHRCFY